MTEYTGETPYDAEIAALELEFIRMPMKPRTPYEDVRQKLITMSALRQAYRQGRTDAQATIEGNDALQQAKGA